jgi:hypothetical protein
MRSLGFGTPSPCFKLIRAHPAELSVTTGLPVSTKRNPVFSYAPLAADPFDCCHRADLAERTGGACLIAEDAPSSLPTCSPGPFLWEALLCLVPLFSPHPEFSEESRVRA